MDMTFQLKGKFLKLALNGLQERINKICNKAGKLSSTKKILKNIEDIKEKERLNRNKKNKRIYNRLKHNEYQRNYYQKKKLAKLENKLKKC